MTTLQKKYKEIWDAARLHLQHEHGEICKGDAAYTENAPDFDSYFDKNISGHLGSSCFSKQEIIDILHKKELEEFSDGLHAKEKQMIGDTINTIIQLLPS